MKKIVKSIVVILAVALLVCGVMYILGYGVFEPKSANANVKIITENYKTEIILYGSDVDFDEACYVRKINEISKDNLTSDESFIYTVFIINDLEENITLSDVELDIIKDKVLNDKIDFFYFGKSNVKNIVDEGIFSQELLEGEMSLGVIYEKGIKTEVLGTWTAELNRIYGEKNPDLLAESILDEIVSKIRYDNK